MRIRILGSAAAEGWPALFCECEGCRKARANGGKDIRRRCAYAIDDDTLVDFGPDIFCQSLLYNLDLARVQRLLVTHSHTDHLSPYEFNWRIKGFSAVTHPLNIYLNQASMDRIISNPHLKSMEAIQVKLNLVKPGDAFADGDMAVTAILADHASEPELPLNYVIQRNGVTALIGNDSGWWCEESWEMLKQFKLDIVIIECTYGLKWPDQRRKHLGGNVSVEVRDKLRAMGVLKDNALVAVNHFSHNCQNLHNDFEAFFNPKEIMVGYDGMILER